MTKLIIFLGIIIVAMLIISFFVRVVLKVVLIAGVVFLLFNLAFIWKSDDLNEKLRLNELLKPEVNDFVHTEYNNFSEKREQNSIVDAEALKEIINDTAHDLLNETTDKISEIDKEAILMELEEKLKQYSKDDIQNIIQETELRNLPFTEEELKRLGE